MDRERLVHRLEAFSDVVIGFVLAEMAITLAVPKTVPTPADVGVNLCAFGVTFGLVAILWYLHNRLFAAYFVANTLMIGLNFVMLAGLIMMAYLFGLALHFADKTGWTTLMGMWFDAFACVYLLLGAMYGIGAYLRRRELGPGLFASGAMRCATALLASGIMLFFGFAFVHFRRVSDLHVTPVVAVVAVAIIFAVRFVGTRWLAKVRAVRANPR